MAETEAYGVAALAPNDWRGQWVNRQQLLSRLGLMWPIVYSTGAWLYFERNTDEYARAPLLGSFAREDNVWIDEPPRALLRWPRLRSWDRQIVALQAGRLRKRLALDGAMHRFAYIFHPSFLPYVASLRADKLIYHAYDLFDHQPSWNRILEDAERTLLARADLVIVPSEALAEELRKKVDRPISVLLNAADVPLYLRAAGTCQAEADPADLAAVPHPRIGYVGSLHPQIDFALLRALVERRRDWHWVLIGPRQREKDLIVNPDFVALAAQPNVHMLGAKTRSEVAQYTVRMDANVMIYKSGDASWTRVAYPLKLHEYLASGRPVVSVELPMLRPLSAVIRFATDVDDWLSALDHAVVSGGTGTCAERQAAAADHGWDARARQLDGWLRALARVDRGSRVEPDGDDAAGS
jgi:glycosyltransferase involved in cell wall biosynthesis